MRRIFAAAAALAGLAGGLLAPGGLPAIGPQDSVKPRVAALVERFPAETAAERDDLCAELMRLGGEAVLEICSRLRPPEAGDDARARFAVNGLAVYVTRPGAEKERLVYIRALHRALKAERDKNVVAFLISQVQLAGKAESVGPLAGYLLDENLVEPAAAALQAIGGRGAARAFLRALARAPRAVKPRLARALGELRDRAAVGKLLVLAESEDEALRRASRFALAEIGDPAAGPLLSRSPVTATLRERSEAPALYLRFARRLVESGRRAAGLAAARAILKTYVRPEESHWTAEALAVVVMASGPDAQAELLAAAEDSDPRLRGAARSLAASIPGPEATAQWLRLAASSGPVIQAEIIDMLGRRGDPSALPFVRESLFSREPAVRAAAIPAAARLGGDAVLSDLFRLAGAAPEEDIPALKAALLGYRADLVLPEAVRLLDGIPLPGKALLIDILGEKGARAETDRLFALAAASQPAVRSAAVAALAKLAGEADLPRLLALLERAADPEEGLRLQDAVAASVLRNPDAESRADRLLEHLAEAPPAGKQLILRLLPKVGGAQPLRAAVAETASGDPQVQSVAVYALSQWPEFRAADELLNIIRTTRTKKHLLLALEGYVRLVGRAALPPARKLALFKDLLGLPMDDADRRAVLTGAAAVREPEALTLLAGYIGHPVLGQAAAGAILDLASDQAPGERWLSGHEAISVLRRVEASPDDPSERDRAGAVILERLRQGGFVQLFNGRGLDGWKGLVADPPRRAKTTPAELAAAQAEADARMRAHWKAVDGVLVFDGKGESLCTLGDYGDFELLVDWKIEKGGDSGIYLRGSPQVQIWDAEANPAGSGGLYNNQRGRSQPLEKADRPAGEWNTFRIIVIGERVTVYLNDRLVVDNTVLENYWERDKPIYPVGQVELQAHGNPLAFRNIFIREIPRDKDAPQPTASEAAEGFVPLFNGRDLDGWTGDTRGYVAESGKLVIYPERGSGNLYTAKEYADFVLRFDFKLTPGANNGLGVRAPLEGDAAYAGLELQILEDGSPIYWSLKPFQYHGSIYGVVPAKRGVLRPVGEWNAEEVTVEGRRVRVVVNGTVVVDADLDAAGAGGTVDGRDHPGLKRASGHIGFLGHGSIVEFRNIRLRESR